MLSCSSHGASGILTILFGDGVSIVSSAHRGIERKDGVVGKRTGAGFTPSYLKKSIWAALRLYASSGCEGYISTGCSMVTWIFKKLMASSRFPFSVKIPSSDFTSHNFTVVKSIFWLGHRIKRRTAGTRTG